MKVAIPKTINFLSTNIPASSETEWSAGTYNSGDMVKDTRTTPHMLYKSPIDGNTTDPASADSLWGRGTATNQWAMADVYVNSQSSGNLAIDGGAIIVTVDSSKCDKVGLLNMDKCAYVNLSMTFEGSEVFNEDIDLEESSAQTRYEYMFRTFRYRSDVTAVIPRYFDSELTITFYPNENEVAKCGHIVVGEDIYIGDSLADISPGTEDFSKFDVNQFGETFLLPGNRAKTVNVVVNVDTNQSSWLKRTLDKLTATPLLWDCNNENENYYDSIVLFAYYRSMQPVINDPVTSTFNFELRGMV